MKIGIIGISSLTLELAFRSAEYGYEVKIHNPKGNSLVRDAVHKMGSHVQLCPLEEAASMEVVILFIHKDDLTKTINRLPDMSGKLMVHTSSLIFDPLSLLSSITNALTYQITASMLPEARVVKLFNPVNLKPKKNLINCKNKDEVFFIADQTDSRNQIRDFLKKLQFSPIDLSGKIHLQDRAINIKTFINPSVINPFKNNLN